MKKEISILIGPAAIGKTTYVQNTYPQRDGLCMISRDDIVGRVSLKYNLSYDDLYNFPPQDACVGDYISGFENYGKVIESPSVVRHLKPLSYEYLNDVNSEIHYTFYNEFQFAARNPFCEHIVIDRVHLRKEERVIYFKYIEHMRSQFNVTALIFNFQDPDTLDIIEKMSEFRKQKMATGGRFRTVPRSVQENMIKFYQEPTISEGYDSIIKVDTLPALRKVLNLN